MEYILLPSSNPKSIFAYLDFYPFIWFKTPLTKIIQKHSTTVKALLLKLIVSHPCYLPLCCTGYNEFAEKYPTQRPLLEVSRIREKVPKRCMVFFDGIICFWAHYPNRSENMFFCHTRFKRCYHVRLLLVKPDCPTETQRIWYTKLTRIST